MEKSGRSRLAHNQEIRGSNPRPVIMQVDITDRGFGIIRKNTFANEPILTRLIQESSSIEPSLWIGADHLLNKDEVKDLIIHLQKWVETDYL